jgi:RNA polymerase primary sigma factor
MKTSGEEPSLDEVAEVIGIETERLAHIMWAVEESECIDGDAPVNEDINDIGATLFSFLQDSQVLSPFDLALRAQLEVLIRERLTAKQAEVLLQRFGFGDSGEQTLEQVGNRLGLTRERVRQIQDGALTKLGRILEGMISIKRKKR